MTKGRKSQSRNKHPTNNNNNNNNNNNHQSNLNSSYYSSSHLNEGNEQNKEKFRMMEAYMSSFLKKMSFNGNSSESDDEEEDEENEGEEEIICNCGRVHKKGMKEEMRRMMMRREMENEENAFLEENDFILEEVWQDFEDELGNELFVETFQHINMIPVVQVSALKRPGSEASKLAKAKLEGKNVHAPQPSKEMINSMIQKCSSLNPPISLFKKFRGSAESVLQVVQNRFETVMDLDMDWNEDSALANTIWDMEEEEDEVYFFDSQFEEEDDDDWQNNGIPLGRIKIGDWSPDICYSNQIRMRYDPKDNKFYFYAFLQPSEYWNSQNINKASNNLNSAKTVLRQSLNRFKTSRVMRWDVDISSLSGMIFSQYDDANEMSLLVLELNQSPQFWTRRIQTASSIRNRWRRRTDFTPGQQIAKNSRYYILAPDHYLRLLIAVLLEKEGESFSNLFQKGIPNLKTENPILSPLPVHKFTVPRQSVEYLKKHDLFRGEVRDYHDPLDFKSFLPFHMQEGCFVQAASQYSSFRFEYVLQKHVHESNGRKDGEEIVLIDWYKNASEQDRRELYYSFCTEHLERRAEAHHCNQCESCDFYDEMDQAWECHVCKSHVEDAEKFCSGCGAVRGQKLSNPKKKLDVYVQDETNEKGIVPKEIDYDSENDTPAWPSNEKSVRQLKKGETVTRTKRISYEFLRKKIYDDDDDYEDEDDEEEEEEEEQEEQERKDGEEKELDDIASDFANFIETAYSHVSKGEQKDLSTMSEVLMKHMFMQYLMQKRGTANSEEGLFQEIQQMPIFNRTRHWFKKE